MRTVIKLFLILHAMSVSIQCGENSWSSLGPYGGDVREIVVHPENPNIIYASVLGSGLFKSSDGGVSWSLIKDAKIRSGGYDIEFDPDNSNTMYFGTFDGIFKTENGGSTWKKTLAVNLSLDIEINPFKSQMLIAAAQNLYHSVDQGENWNYGGFGNVNTYNVEYDPTRPNVFFVGTNFVHTKKTHITLYGVCKTTDNGATFTRVGDNMEDLIFPKDIQIDPNDTNKVYVVGVNQRYYNEDDRFTPYRSIFLSTDGGDTFACINNGLKVNRVLKILIDPRSNNVIYVCTKEKGICKSIDGGLTWIQKNNGIRKGHTRTVTLDQINEILYLGTSDGIFKSTDNSETWQDISQGMNAFPVTSLAQNLLNPNTLYVAGSYLPRKSIDNGKTWQRIGSGYLDSAFVNQIAIDPKDSNTVYAGVTGIYNSNAYGVWQSRDGGITWQEKNNGLPYIPYIWEMKLAPNDSSTTLALATEIGFFISFDGAETWEERNNGICDDTPFDKTINTITIDPNNHRVMYACASQLYKTYDQGLHWEVIRPFAPFWYYETYVNPHNSTQVFVGEGGQIFVSENGGKDWEFFMDGYMLAISPSDPQLMLAARGSKQGGGMKMSRDGGQTWQAMDNGWHKPSVYLIRFDVFNPNKVYVGSTASGLYCCTISPSEVTDKNPLAPLKDYALFQNYPNPFNGVTIIKYQLPVAEYVRIDVLNLLAQRMSILVDEHKQAGNYRVLWDGKDESGRNVASGIYLYQCKIGEFSDVKKMVLMR